MNRPLAILLLLASVAGPAGAAPARRTAASRPAAPAPAPAPAAAKPGGPRRLDDIHIEGEIPVPQVLFITTRDQRRYLEFQHRRYRRDGLAGPRALPDFHFVNTATPRNDKETQR